MKAGKDEYKRRRHRLITAVLTSSARFGFGRSLGIFGKFMSGNLHCVGRRACPRPHSSYEYDDDWHFVLEREILGLYVAMLLKVIFQLGCIWMYGEYDEL